MVQAALEKDMLVVRHAPSGLLFVLGIFCGVGGFLFLIGLFGPMDIPAKGLLIFMGIATVLAGGSGLRSYRRPLAAFDRASNRFEIIQGPEVVRGALDELSQVRVEEVEGKWRLILSHQGMEYAMQPWADAKQTDLEPVCQYIRAYRQQK